MSDLNPTTQQMIRDRTQQLSQTESISPDRLQELESHLTDSVSELKQMGLNEGESFLVATSRLGSVDELAKEYAKTDESFVWSNRVFWMCLGFVAIGLLGKTVTSLTVLAQVLVCWISYPGGLSMGVANYLTAGMTILGWCVICVGLLTLSRRSKVLGVRMSPSRLILATLAVLLLTSLSQIAGQIGLSRLVSVEELGQLAIGKAYSSIAVQGAVPIALIMLAFISRRRGYAISRDAEVA